MTDRLHFPLPPERDNTIRIFPAATHHDPCELVLHIPEDAECCICHRTSHDTGRPMLVMATTDGKGQQIYCGVNCVYVHLSAVAAEGPSRL